MAAGEINAIQIGDAGPVAQRQTHVYVVVLVVRRAPGAGGGAGQQWPNRVADLRHAHAQLAGQLTIDADRQGRLGGLEAGIQIHHARHRGHGRGNFFRQALNFFNVLALHADLQRLAATYGGKHAQVSDLYAGDTAQALAHWRLQRFLV